MKKYKLIAIVFIFVLGLFINFNSVSAANCAPGDLFNTTTGQACATTSTIVTCPTGDLFSSTTGQRCTAWQGNSNSSEVAQFNSLFRSYFAVGARGNDVISLQQFLKNQQYYFGKVDGIYGSITARAVSDFQSDYNIITFSTQPFITVVSPNRGEVLQMGNIYDIKWNCPAEKAGGSFDIYASRLTGNGSTKTLIGSVIECSPGKYSWKVGEATPYSYGEEVITPGNSFKIQLREIAGAAALIDESDNYFSIVATTLSNNQNVESGNDVNGTHIGYIKSISSQNNSSSLVIDYVQWIVPCPSGEDCTNGYKVVNSNPQLRTFPISNNVQIKLQTYISGNPIVNNLNQVVDLPALDPNQNVTLSVFTNALNNSTGIYKAKNLLYWITLSNGVVTNIAEQYQP